jgi:hypothetical protein
LQRTYKKAGSKDDRAKASYWTEFTPGVSENFPFWELLVHTPAVFVRVANKGVAGYGTWKKIRKMGDKESRGSQGSKGDKGCKAERTESAGLRTLASVESLIHISWSHETLTLSRNN